MAKTKATNKKKNVRVDAMGQLHVHSSFNNIIVSLANNEGQIISWSSAGKMGFRGSKKNTPYAAQMAAEDCAKVAYDLGLRKVKAYVISCSSIGFDGPSVANFRPKCHHPTLEFPQPNVARAVLRRVFILFQQSRHIQLHDEQAHKHQRRAEIAAHRQALAEQEIGEHGGEYRLERKDQARVARRGELLLNALDDEADARAKHAEEQRFVLVCLRGSGVAIGVIAVAAHHCVEVLRLPA